jgi:cytochrome P450
MRLYPQAFLIGRKAIEPFRIDDYEFPKRTTVILNQWSIGRDPRWFDDPDDFDPDRWIGDWEARLPSRAYFPYGGGARICMGRSLARLELPLVLAMLVQRFRFALTADAEVRPRPSLTLRPVWDRGAITIARR